MACHPLDRVTPPSFVITASSFIILREFVGNNNSSLTHSTVFLWRVILDKFTVLVYTWTIMLT